LKEGGNRLGVAVASILLRRQSLLYAAPVAKWDGEVGGIGVRSQNRQAAALFRDTGKRLIAMAIMESAGVWTLVSGDRVGWCGGLISREPYLNGEL